MTEGVKTTRQARRMMAGLAACLAATAAIIALAWPDRGISSIRIDYELKDDQVIASGLPIGERNRDIRDSNLPDRNATVRDHLQSLSRTGDSRYLRYAKKTLDERTANSAMTFDELLLKARILQVEHEFLSAATYLRQALAIRRDSAEAWLLLSDSLRRAGDPIDARAACLQLALAGESTLAKFCGIQILQSLGEIQRAYNAQQGFIDTLAVLPVDSRIWALSVAADTAAYAGAEVEAYGYFETAMSLGQSTLALRLAFADFLLENGRHREVADVLEYDKGNNSAMLRIAIADKLNGVSTRSPAADAVEASLQLAADTNEAVRFRDRAIWELRFREDVEAAHDLAMANWSTQKSYEDLVLLRTAAAAAGRSDTLEMLENWLAKAAKGGTS